MPKTGNIGFLSQFVEEKLIISNCPELIDQLKGGYSFMSRRPGPHPLKLELILYALRAHPQGLWIRELSRISGLKKSTVSNYLTNHMADKIETVHHTNHIKIVKLKTAEQIPNYLQ